MIARTRERWRGLAQPVAHFAVGMAVPFCAAATIWVLRPRRPRPGFVYVPVIMLLCGCWALVPKALGAVSPGVNRVLTIPVFGDIFFFHALLTRTGKGGDAWGMILLVMMWGCVVAGYLRYFRRLKSGAAGARRG